MGKHRLDAAVRKAGARRLLADFAEAARLVADAQRIYAGSSHSIYVARAAYVSGAIETTGSMTVRACLLTAFGC